MAITRFIFNAKFAKYLESSCYFELNYRYERKN
jgi:hypothetical protein